MSNERSETLRLYIGDVGRELSRGITVSTNLTLPSFWPDDSLSGHLLYCLVLYFSFTLGGWTQVVVALLGVQSDLLTSFHFQLNNTLSLSFSY